MCIRVDTCVDDFQGLVLFFHYVGAGAWILVLSLGSKHLYLLSQPASLCIGFVFLSQSIRCKEIILKLSVNLRKARERKKKELRESTDK